MKRAQFRAANQLMLLLWHAGLGGAMNATHRLTGRLMVLGTVGRKSGLMRRTPLNYAREGDDVFALAGFGPRTDWYRNLLAHPFAEIWLPDGFWLARAEVVGQPFRRLRALRQVLQDSGLASKAFAGLDPWTASEAELERETADYQVVRLRLLEPLPEPEEMQIGRAARVGLEVGLALSLAWAWLYRKD